MPTQTISRCGGSGGVTYDEIIISLGVRAFYKLDELAGSTAFDSSGNGYDAVVPAGSFSAPTWGQPAGPPGATTALFFRGLAPVRLHNAAFPLLSGEVTACAWIKRTDAEDMFAVGEGDPILNHTGFSLEVEAFNRGLGNRAVTIHGTGPSATPIEGDSPLVDGGWHFLAVTRTGSLWNLYVDGAVQTGSNSTAFAGASDLWMGSSAAGTLTTQGYISYVQVYDQALSATAIGLLYAAA